MLNVSYFWWTRLFFCQEDDSTSVRNAKFHTLFHTSTVFFYFFTRLSEVIFVSLLLIDVSYTERKQFPSVLLRFEYL